MSVRKSLTSKMGIRNAATNLNHIIQKMVEKLGKDYK